MLAGLERIGVSDLRRRVWSRLGSADPGDRLLEIGVGGGRNQPHHPDGWTVVGVDRSLRILERARRRGLGLVVAAEADRLPFPAASFEAVVETFVWCEVEDPQRALDEAAEVLADEGRMLMLDHVRPEGGAGRFADLLTRLSGPLVGEHWNRDTRIYAGASPLRLLAEETLSGGWVRLLLLERRSRAAEAAAGQRASGSTVADGDRLETADDAVADELRGRET